MGALIPQMKLDAAHNVIVVSHPNPIHLETAAEITAYFESGIAFWRRLRLGEKVYWLVDYDNFTFNTDLTDVYVTSLKRITDECIIAVVRYGGRMLQRNASRMMAIKLHVPSRVYPSYAEAMSAI